MVIFRRRLIFWLIKAYIKKSGKTLVISFVLGLIIFFTFIFASKYIVKHIPIYKKTTVGIVGSYSEQNLPPIVVDKISRGLTHIAEDGSVKPDIASIWTVTDDGKTYTFNLQKNIYFSDKKELTSEEVQYNFSDVTIERPDKYTIIFKLKDAYSPFLTTVSKPIIKKGFVGVGEYQIEDIKLNGSYVQSLALTSVTNRLDRVRFQFYPTEEALKIAFLLGEVSEVAGLTDKQFKAIDFATFPGTETDKKSNYSRLVTLFFNTEDKILSDKKLRLALNYAVPDTFAGGERSYLPYSPRSIYNNTDFMGRQQDFEHAKLLLEASSGASGSGATPITIKALKQYKAAAESVAASWQRIGVDVKVEEVDGIPPNFEIFLGDFYLPRDPDQYTLWHSGQKNNITKYKNLRIDKLLEDGRKTVDADERKNIYADFQKYLLDDVPAIFLYFPTEYHVRRK